MRGYLIGLGLAIALTLASFWAAGTHIIYGPGVPIVFDLVFGTVWAMFHMNANMMSMPATSTVS